MNTSVSVHVYRDMSKPTPSKEALRTTIETSRLLIASGGLTAEQTTIAKNGMISAAIMLARLDGATLREAMDGVLGAGTYDATVKATYEGLRAKAAA